MRTPVHILFSCLRAWRFCSMNPCFHSWVNRREFCTWAVSPTNFSFWAWSLSSSHSNTDSYWKFELEKCWHIRKCNLYSVIWGKKKKKRKETPSSSAGTKWGLMALSFFILAFQGCSHKAHLGRGAFSQMASWYFLWCLNRNLCFQII